MNLNLSSILIHAYWNKIDLHKHTFIPASVFWGEECEAFSSIFFFCRWVLAKHQQGLQQWFPGSAHAESMLVKKIVWKNAQTYPCTDVSKHCASILRRYVCTRIETRRHTYIQIDAYMHTHMHVYTYMYAPARCHWISTWTCTCHSNGDFGCLLLQEILALIHQLWRWLNTTSWGSSWVRECK